MAKKVGVLLSGCGVFDGSEIHEETIGALNAMGVKHTVCSVDEIAVDARNKIVSTPAYMLGPGIKDVARGIEKGVKQILSMI